MVKNSACQCRRPWFNPWVGKIPWRRKWQPTPVFLPREFEGQRSLVGYGPWGLKESDTTEQLTLSPSDWPTRAYVPKLPQEEMGRRGRRGSQSPLLWAPWVLSLTCDGEKDIWIRCKVKIKIRWTGLILITKGKPRQLCDISLRFKKSRGKRLNTE